MSALDRRASACATTSNSLEPLQSARTRLHRLATRPAHQPGGLLSSLLVSMLLVAILVPHALGQTETAEKPPAPEPSTSESASPEPKLLEVGELAAQAKPSLFVIHGTGRDGRQDRVGTGFAVAPDLIATNLHVIGEGRDFEIEDSTGRKLVPQAVLASDRLFDLAVVRVKAEDDKPLVPLPLGDPADLKDGASIVVLGNPLGYKHSVVQGVLSGKRQIDGRNMLQLAIPIEPGNSGGPVLDRKGRVYGVVTMKSTASNNLGFAVESTAVQRLIDNPNPIRMSRWVVMNRIDTSRWKTLFGARWQQRGGKIVVDGQGAGFGGRSLCLYQQDPPELPFELAVDVKLDDESGAAGLVFHADGQDRHYGFYPSNGKLRLSCFQGPSVYSWKVLRDEPSIHYRAGQWNRLKVRVEEDVLLCFVNDELVFQAADQTFRSGKVGLAKFRTTEAEFKGFEVAREVESDQIADEARKELLAQIEKLASLEETAPRELEPFTQRAPASMKMLRERADALEQRAEELRRIAQDVHVRSIAARIEKLFPQKPDDDQTPDMLRAALLVDALDHDDLDVASYIDAVDRMATEISDGLKENASESQRLSALHTYLFEDNGYHGSRADYYHRANSHIHRVIDDREGLPITLSVLYMELGERLGLDIQGVSLPGHFLVRFVPSDKDQPHQLIDVYENGSELTAEEASRKSREITGQPVDAAQLPAATPREILERMLMNLLNVAQQEADQEAMLRYLDGLLALDPDSVQYRGMRAVVRFETGRRDASLEDLDRILEEQPAGLDMERVRQMRDYFQHGR